MPNPGDFSSIRTNGRPLMGLLNIADLIRRFTKSTTNHSVTYYGLIGTVPYVGEAQPGGYRLVPLSTYDGTEFNWSTEAVPLTAAQGVIAQRMMHTFSTANGGKGVPYNFIDIGDLFLALVLGFTTPGFIKRRLARPDRLMCSQAADLIDQAMGIHLFADRLAGEVTPGDLDRYVTAHNPVAV